MLGLEKHAALMTVALGFVRWRRDPICQVVSRQRWRLKFWGARFISFPTWFATCFFGLLDTNMHEHVPLPHDLGLVERKSHAFRVVLGWVLPHIRFGPSETSISYENTTSDPTISQQNLSS
jgi:hypothetical protein